MQKYVCVVVPPSLLSRVCLVGFTTLKVSATILTLRAHLGSCFLKKEKCLPPHGHTHTRHAGEDSLLVDLDEPSSTFPMANFLCKIHQS